jgi:hypothetical protein
VSNHRRLLLSPLWFIVALATIVGLNASSAAAGGGLETRVRAFEHVTVDSVGQQSSERPASVGSVRPETVAMAVGSCVATNTAPKVTESMIRDAMENSPLQTQQGAVSLPKVQSAVDQLAAGSPAPPIKVDGSIIVDGNHRYIAGQIMGQPPAVQPWPGGNPARVVPWWKQVIDPTDWGG